MPSGNPFLGVVFHAIGGLAAASFYLPYKKVRGWSWEAYWLCGGVFSWILAPIVFVLLLAPGSLSAIAQTPLHVLFWTYAFGVLWGIGGLTFGLSMRYLGIALGYAVALGLCAAFGTLMPPLIAGKFGELLGTKPGLIVLSGVVLCLVGIALSGKAGLSKEAELSAEAKRETVAEFNFSKGLLVAIFAGLMSACMAYAFEAGTPLKDAALKLGTPEYFPNLPVLVVVLLGGFTTNCIWCLFLLKRNGTLAEFGRAEVDGVAAPLRANYLFSALAGVTWYLQFFFYGMGTTQMGRFGFASWSLHMAFIIIFSTLWGIALQEWRGTSKRTHGWIAAGLIVLVLSTTIIGWGNTLAADGAKAAEAAQTAGAAK